MQTNARVHAQNRPKWATEETPEGREKEKGLGLGLGQGLATSGWLASEQAAQASGYYPHVSYSRIYWQLEDVAVVIWLLGFYKQFENVVLFMSLFASNHLLTSHFQTPYFVKIKHVAVHAVAETDVCISLPKVVHLGFSILTFRLTWICNVYEGRK
jgi:hypothetical protein